MKKKYKQRLEKIEELFVDQQRKMLRNQNEDSGVFFSQDGIVNAIAEFNYARREGNFFRRISVNTKTFTKRTVPICFRNCSAQRRCCIKDRNV